MAVLASPSFRELQKLFYEVLLRDGRLLSTEDRQFVITTQDVDKELGRPDLRIEGLDTLILLENKFAASFTPNQMVRYAAKLDQARKSVRVLALACPNYLKSGYERDVVQQFREQGWAVSGIVELHEQLLSRQIRLVVVTWEELLRVLDSGDFLLSQLADFVRERFLVHVHFNREQVSRLMNTEIPELLEKLITLVDRVKGEIGGHGFETGRSSQSIRYWGFNFQRDNTRYYFAYMLNFWGKHRTPLFLQTSPTWDGNGHLTEDLLIRSGFTKEAVDNFLLPVRLHDGDENAVLTAVLSELRGAADRVAAEVVGQH